MQVYSNVKRFYSSLQDRVPFRRRKEMKRQVVISHPFDFKKEASILPGFTEDEISVLREKAAASRLGIADNLYPPSLSCDPSPSPSLSPSSSGHYTKYGTLPAATPTRAMRRRSGSVSVISIPTMGMGHARGAVAASFPGRDGGLHVPVASSGGGSGSGSLVATPMSVNGPVDLDFCLLSPLAMSPVGVHGHGGLGYGYGGSCEGAVEVMGRVTRGGRSKSA